MFMVREAKFMVRKSDSNVHVQIGCDRSSCLDVTHGIQEESESAEVSCDLRTDWLYWYA
jgi:hypothetical protein